MTSGVEAELEAARQARAAGNEGRARTCARRAAGLAIRAYYQKCEGAGWGGDAMAQLSRLKADVAIPEALRAMATRLTTVVDFDHNLPFEDDLLLDARRIIDWLSEGGPGPDPSATA